MSGQGITSTATQVRVVMGLSFYDESSLVEITSTLRFGSNHLTSIPETGNGIQERRDNNIGIDIVEIDR